MKYFKGELIDTQLNVQLFPKLLHYSLRLLQFHFRSLKKEKKVQFSTLWVFVLKLRSRWNGKYTEKRKFETLFKTNHRIRVIFVPWVSASIPPSFLIEMKNERMGEAQLQIKKNFKNRIQVFHSIKGLKHNFAHCLSLSQRIRLTIRGSHRRSPKRTGVLRYIFSPQVYVESRSIPFLQKYTQLIFKTRKCKTRTIASEENIARCIKQREWEWEGERGERERVRGERRKQWDSVDLITRVAACLFTLAS